MTTHCRFVIFQLTLITLTFSAFLTPLKTQTSAVPFSNCVIVDVGYSIQEAINNATEGSIIIISSGIHIEDSYPIVVNKTLTIVGEDLSNAIIDGNQTDRGIFLIKSNNIRMGNLTIQNTTTSQGVSGIHLYNVCSVEVFDLIITNCGSGIQLTNSSNCTITRNNVTSNHSVGIYIHGASSYNQIFGNFVTDNPTGIWIADLQSANNKIFHNSFINNNLQQSSVGSYTAWDNGYPSGGNYWNDHSQIDIYHGVDQNLEGSDGLIDVNYADIDRYPLAKPQKLLQIYTLDQQNYYSMIITNSSIISFYFAPEVGSFINFTVKSEEGATGFCRISVPKNLLWIESGERWLITINGTTDNSLILEDESYTYFYLTYGQGVVYIQIQGSHVIPEIPAISDWIFWMLFSTLLLLTIKMIEKSMPNLSSLRVKYQNCLST